MDIEENFKEIRKRVPEEVSIVAATKTRTAEEVERAISAGVNHFGENYVQEAQKKKKIIGGKAEKVNWHMIGHLQKNKINKALPLFDSIQTIESEYRAKHVNKRAGREEMINKRGKETIKVLIQVNIGKEESKYGIEPNYNQIKELSESISEMKHLELKGLMTMEPYSEDPEDSRPYFKKMKDYYEKLREESFEMEILSMGMTNSYKVAVEEGSNMIRVGRAIFGERKD